MAEIEPQRHYHGAFLESLRSICLGAVDAVSGLLLLGCPGSRQRQWAGECTLPGRKPHSVADAEQWAASSCDQCTFSDSHNCAIPDRKPYSHTDAEQYATSNCNQCTFSDGHNCAIPDA